MNQPASAAPTAFSAPETITGAATNTGTAATTASEANGGGPLAAAPNPSEPLAAGAVSAGLSADAPGPSPEPPRAEADPRASELARQLSATMARLHQRGWCDGTGGNFSCVWQRQPLRLLMAPSGVDKGEVRPQELIVVDAEGLVVQGEGRASAETRLHLEIVARTGAGAVLHTHSQAATLLSQWALGPVEEANTGGCVALHNLEMLKGLAGITSHNTQVKIPVLANDQDLIRLSRQASPLLRDAPWGLLIGGHGLYAWGADLAEARRHLEILEFLLEQRWRQWLLEALMPRQSPSSQDGGKG